MFRSRTRRKAAVPTAGQVVPRVDVQNKQLKGLLMLDQYPWMVKLLDGRTVSPSEFERLAGSLRKNWKSSTMVLQVIRPPFPGVWLAKDRLRIALGLKLTWGRQMSNSPASMRKAFDAVAFGDLQGKDSSACCCLSDACFHCGSCKLF